VNTEANTGNTATPYGPFAQGKVTCVTSVTVQCNALHSIPFAVFFCYIINADV